MKKIFSGIGAILLIIIIIVIVNTLTFSSKQMKIKKKKINIMINENIAARHLADSLKFKTISYHDVNKFNKSEFIKFHHYLKKTYPLSH